MGVLKTPCDKNPVYPLTINTSLVMSLTLLARASARQSIARTRALHTTSPVRDVHGHYHVRIVFSPALRVAPLTLFKHLPFDFPTSQNKGIFGLKVAAYLITGFSIPFVASWWQLYM